MKLLLPHEDLKAAYTVWLYVPYLAEQVNNVAPGTISWNDVRWTRENAAGFIALHVLVNLSRSALYGVFLGALLRPMRGMPGLSPGILLTDVAIGAATVLMTRRLNKYSDRLDSAIERLENAAADRGLDLYDSFDDYER